MKNITLNLQGNKIIMLETSISELKPNYDSAKSFYGRAEIYQDDNLKVLKSYDSFVCCINNGNVYLNSDLESNLLFSTTTLRHIKEFLQQNGFSKMKKSELEKLLDTNEFMEVNA